MWLKLYENLKIFGGEINELLSEAYRSFKELRNIAKLLLKVIDAPVGYGAWGIRVRPVLCH